MTGNTGNNQQQQQQQQQFASFMLQQQQQQHQMLMQQYNMAAAAQHLGQWSVNSGPDPSSPSMNRQVPPTSSTLRQSPVTPGLRMHSAQCSNI